MNSLVFGGNDVDVEVGYFVNSPVGTGSSGGSGHFDGELWSIRSPRLLGCKSSETIVVVSSALY